MATLNPPLRPRSGTLLRVLIVARISTIHQDSRSLSEQESLCKQRVAAMYPGRTEYRVIASRGSGEILDRKELDDVKDLIESDTLDLVIVEDLARLCRRNTASRVGALILHDPLAERIDEPGSQPGSHFRHASRVKIIT